MMPGTRAEVRTTLGNVALEPDVTALGRVLNGCGAGIEGLGSRRLVIHGVHQLAPIETTIIPDRIETATFMAAAAITGSTITLEECEPLDVAAALHKLEEAGCEVLPEPQEITITGPRRLGAVN